MDTSKFNIGDTVSLPPLSYFSKSQIMEWESNGWLIKDMYRYFPGEYRIRVTIIKLDGSIIYKFDSNGGQVNNWSWSEEMVFKDKYFGYNIMEALNPRISFKEGVECGQI